MQSAGQVIATIEVAVITSVPYTGLIYQNSCTKPVSVGNGFSLATKRHGCCLLSKQCVL